MLASSHYRNVSKQTTRSCPCSCNGLCSSMLCDLDFELLSLTWNSFEINSDGFTEVEGRNNKGLKKGDEPLKLKGRKTKGPTDANSSINKVNGPSTSNSFDILNNVDEGDACCVSSYMGNEEVDQAVGHATISKHTSPTWNEDFKSDDEVDEVIFPEGNKFEDQFDIRLKGRAIGNGRQTNMWYDNWSTGLGPLMNCITHRSLYNAGIDKTCRVSDMIEDGVWRWPSEWYENYPFLSNMAVPNLTPNKNDSIIWVDNEVCYKEFCKRVVYDTLRESIEEVIWGSLVWFSQCIPKHSFILWMAIQGKLLTQDMILRWGSYDMMEIWSNMLIMMDWNVPNFGWNEIVERLTAMPCKRSIGSNIRRLCLETRIMGLRVKKSSAVSSVAAKWNIINENSSKILCEDAIYIVFGAVLEYFYPDGLWWRTNCDDAGSNSPLICLVRMLLQVEMD
ncbi:RNA-directed DNA polymerase, eukaryota, reverse transcriptase zinc-binding domain protein [Tanacetum coccineum]